MNEKEIKRRVELTERLLKAMTNDMNLPDTNLFYELLLKVPIVAERINVIKEMR